MWRDTEVALRLKIDADNEVVVMENVQLASWRTRIELLFHIYTIKVFH
jgi:hypothetical protein